MTHYDIFNGDADGLCALHQLRLSDPRDSVLITGVKRDTALVQRVHAQPGDHLTVLDIGLAQNREAVVDALTAGATCLYFDHHHPGEPLEHPALRAHIRTEADVCTSLLVSEYLGALHESWALCAAFGDGLAEVAQRRCRALGLPQDDIALLRDLGEALNYNAYGDAIEDLHFAPAQLYGLMRPYADARDFARDSAAFITLKEGCRDDLRRAAGQPPLLSSATHYAVALPDTAWSRRVNGVLAHRLSEAAPARAHAVLVRKGDVWLVSVRAPRAAPRGADQLCRRFATGGGRAGAGGINRLPEADLNAFLSAFEAAFA